MHFTGALLFIIKSLKCEPRIDLYKTLVVGIRKALQYVMSFDGVCIATNTVESDILETTQGLAFCSQPFCEGNLHRSFKAMQTSSQSGEKRDEERLSLPCVRYIGRGS